MEKPSGWSMLAYVKQSSLKKNYLHYNNYKPYLFSFNQKYPGKNAYYDSFSKFMLSISGLGNKMIFIQKPYIMAHIWQTRSSWDACLSCITTEEDLFACDRNDQ